MIYWPMSKGIEKFNIYRKLLSKATYSAFRLYIFCQFACSLGIEPTTFVLLTQCSTTEPHEQYVTRLNQKESTEPSI